MKQYSTDGVQLEIDDRFKIVGQVGRLYRGGKEAIVRITNIDTITEKGLHKVMLDLKFVDDGTQHVVTVNAREFVEKLHKGEVKRG